MMSLTAAALLLVLASCAPVAIVNAAGVRRFRAVAQQRPMVADQDAGAVGGGHRRFMQSLCADSACTEGDCTTTEVVQNACYFLTDSTQRTSTAFCRPGGFELVQHTFLWSPNCTGAYSTQMWQTGTCYPSNAGEAFVEFTCEDSYSAVGAAQQPAAQVQRHRRDTSNHGGGDAAKLSNRASELPTPIDVTRQVVA
jgi:hypothetical protein